mgnify:CR=1 FL=1
MLAKAGLPLAQKSGSSCRLAGLKQIRKAFGSFSNAVHAAELRSDTQIGRPISNEAN